MSLRVRLALAFAMLVAVVLGVFATTAWVGATGDLRGSTDEFLIERARTAERVVGRGPFGGEQREFDPAGRGGRGRGNGDFQVIDPDGSVVFDGGLPIEEIDLEFASGRRTGFTLRTVEDDDRLLRLVVASRGGRAVQFARDVTELESGLAQLRTRLLAMGLLGVIAAAALGWVLASRLTRPIGAVAAAATQLAHEQDLPSRIETDRTDEVGQLAQSFNQMMDALAVAREQQRRLVADASHELRTPLTSLRVKVELLERSNDLPDDHRRQLLTGAVSELETLSDLVDELVDLAADVGSSEEAAEPVDLDELVGDVVSRFRQTSGRQVRVQVSGTILDIRPRLAVRALSNLLDNAHKYSPPGEPIEVAEAGGRIEVRDYGEGIPPEDQPFVFDRFFRSATARTRPGNGIGLAIVQRVADIHGGEAWVRSAEGVGVVVGFSLSEA